jgi:hypothetical protein
MLYEQNSQVIQVDMSRSYCYRKVVAIRRFFLRKNVAQGQQYDTSKNDRINVRDFVSTSRNVFAYTWRGH